MKEAEASGSFDYDPNYDPTKPRPQVEKAPIVPEPSVILDSKKDDDNPDAPPPPALQRKTSLDDFELEIEGMHLDENIDTSVSFRP